MASLEDKILGEKAEYYCSSSEEGEEDDDVIEEEVSASTNHCISEGTSSLEPAAWEGTSSNTGPKGVLKDWQRYKQLEAEKSEAKEKERLQLIKKLSLTCKSVLDEEKDKAGEELDGDEFLLHYMHQRMQEMIVQTTTSLPKFGKVIHINDSEHFLQVVDKEHQAVTVVVHLFEENVLGCEAMNGCLTCLSQEYPQVKFCKLNCSIAGLSDKFKKKGVPALLVYKAGQLVGNFVRLTDELGDDFFPSDVGSFLTQHGMLPDKTCVPTIISSTSQHEASDSDDTDY